MEFRQSAESDESNFFSKKMKKKLLKSVLSAPEDSLVKTAVTFYMLQACTQGNFL